MTKYVRLSWERNKDGETDHYVVYRSSTLPVTRSSTKLMKVEQVGAVNPIVVEETVVKTKEGLFLLRYGSIILSSLVVLEDETIVDVERIELHSGDGILRIDDSPDTVRVVYQFDGISVLDTQDASERFAPPSVDTYPIGPPEDMLLMAEFETGTAKITFTKPMSEGKTFYYAIEAVGLSDARSNLSKPIKAFIQEEVVETEIESSRDSSTWNIVALIDQETWIDTEACIEPPYPINNLKVVREDMSARFTWNIDDRKATGMTPMYRLRSITSNGVTSVSSNPVGPEVVSSDPDHILIKRKIDDGSFPTFNGVTSEVVANLPYNGNQEYIDTLPEDEGYAYSLFVIDKSGNHSIASTIRIGKKGEVTA